jgi:hypothetical protein
MSKDLHSAQSSSALSSFSGYLSLIAGRVGFDQLTFSISYGRYFLILAKLHSTVKDPVVSAQSALNQPSLPSWELYRS